MRNKLRLWLIFAAVMLLKSTAAFRPGVLMYSPEEAGQLIGVGRTTVYELLRSGELRSVRVGRLRRMTAADLAAYVERLRESA